MLESQHMGEKREATTTCSVCGGECRIQATMCDKCENTLRGWIHDYPIWIHALREFLDSTAHYGGHQPGRVNLPSAPTPIRLSVVDHLQEIEDAVTALWCRLYAPPAMPWATSIAVPPIVDKLKACWSCQRLNRLPDIGLIWHDWQRLARKTMSHHRRAAIQARHRQVPESSVRSGAECGGWSGKRRLSGVRQRLPRGRRAIGVPAGVHRIGQGIHGGGVRGAAARVRVPVQCEHDSFVAQARQAPAGR